MKKTTMGITQIKNLLAIFIVAFSVAGNASNALYEFKHLSSDNGLAGNTVYCMAQDTLGYAWIGTNKGLSKFDGYSFENYFVADDTLASNWTILDVAVDSRNNVFIATLNNGLWYYDRKLRVFHILDSINISNVKINDICIADSLSFYIATDKGLYVGQYADNTYEILPHKQQGTSATKEAVKKVFVDSKKNIWIATTSKNIYRYQINNKTTPAIYNNNSKNGPNGVVLDFTEDNNGTVWAGTWGDGLFYYNSMKNAWESYSFHSIVGTTIITTLLSAHDGTLYFSTWGNGIGILSADRKSESQWSYNPANPNGLNNNKVWSLMQDNGGNIWIGTDFEGGINIFDYSNVQLKHFSLSTQSTSNHSNISRTFCNDNANNIYVGGSYGIQKFNKNLDCLKTFNILSDNSDIVTTLDIFPTQSHILYATKKGGVFLLNIATRKKEKITLENIAHKKDVEILKILTNRYDNVAWIATKHHGLYKYYLARNKATLATQKITINDIALDEKDALWLATQKYGLVQFQSFTDSYSIIETGITHEKNVLIVQPDSKGNIYFFNDDSGLMAYNTHSGVAISCKKNNFPLKNVKNMSVDSSGCIWVTTQESIYKIQYEDNALSYKKRFNDIENCVFAPNSIKYISGKIYIGSSAGFYTFNPFLENIKLRSNNSPVVLTNIFVNGESIHNKYKQIEHLKSLKLQYNKNSLEIGFSSMNHENVEDEYYYYMLQGFDENFHIAKHLTNKVHYTNLPPGKYLFKIAGIDNGDVHTYRTLSIDIQPPFWKQAWFILLCAILLLIIFIKFIKLREDSLVKTNMQLQKIIDERTSELSEQHKNLKDKNNTLQMQKKMLQEKFAEKKRKQEEIAIQRTNLQEQKLSIELQHRKILENIRYAKKIQEMVLQPQEFLSEVFPQSFLMQKPRDVVGGDFFWTFKHKKKKYIAIADCTGHGVPGAFMSILGYSLLKEILKNNKEESAAFILNELNSKIQKSLSQSFESTTSKDGMDISFCIVDYETMTLNFAGANNPLFLIKNKRLEVIKADKIPIGFYHRKGSFSDTSFRFEKGDSIYLFSDGYVDQFGGMRNKKFKVGTFKKLILEISSYPMRVQLSLLQDTLYKWMSLSPEFTSLEQTDDIIVFGAQL